MLSFDNVTLSYKKRTILQGASFTAAPGTMTAFLGVNGSGKSTLLKAAAGILMPAAGEISFDGISSREAKTYRANFGFVTQEDALMPELSPLDNLRLWTPLKKKEILAALGEPPLAMLGVSALLDVPIRHMSGGMKKRLSLASVLINRPRVLLLDEPFAALDMLAREDILYYLSAFRAEGGIILIASHEKETFWQSNAVYLLKDNSLQPVAPNTNPSELLRATL